MSRWAAGITVAFLFVEWPAVFLMRDSWTFDDCGGRSQGIGVGG